MATLSARRANGNKPPPVTKDIKPITPSSDDRISPSPTPSNKPTLAGSSKQQVDIFFF